MKSLPVRIGLWSSLLAALAMITFTICFAAIFMTQEVAVWSTLEDYIARAGQNNQLFKYIAQACAVVFGLAYLVMVHSFHAIAEDSKKILSRIAISFATVFVVLTGINYFIQITAVQFAIADGQTDGLDQWIMFNPASISLSIAMLGWTFFLGLSSLFTAPVIGNKTIRILFILNGIFCILGGFGFLLRNTALVNLTINLGMGGAVTLLSILSVFFFRKKQS